MTDMHTGRSEQDWRREIVSCVDSFGTLVRIGIEHQGDVAAAVAHAYGDSLRAAFASGEAGAAGARTDVSDLILRIAEVEGTYRVAVLLDDEVLDETADLGLAMPLLMWHVTQRALARCFDAGHAALHAAAVVAAGTTVCLSGRSGSGKSTLAAALVQRGADLVSDELVAVDRDGRILGAARPLLLDQESCRVLGIPGCSVADERTVGPASFDRAWRPRPDGPLTLVFPTVDLTVGAETEPMSRADALVALAGQCFGFDDRPEQQLRVLAGLVRQAHVVRLRFGDIDTACAVLLAASHEAAPQREVMA